MPPAYPRRIAGELACTVANLGQMIGKRFPPLFQRIVKRMREYRWGRAHACPGYNALVEIIIPIGSERKTQRTEHAPVRRQPDPARTPCLRPMRGVRLRRTMGRRGISYVRLQDRIILDHVQRFIQHH